jgi:hypothetical protein
MFRLGLLRGHPTPDEVDEVMLAYRCRFLTEAPAEPRIRMYLTYLVLFPDLRPASWTSVIDSCQRRLKPAFVRSGLMLGQFHPGPPDEPGLWNTEFRPLNSPIPILAIRFMTARDAMFLCQRGDFLAAYLERFGHCVPDSMQAAVSDAALRFGAALQPRPPRIDTADASGGSGDLGIGPARSADGRQLQ